MNIITKSIDLFGRTLSLETGRLAAQATASVLAQYGETSVLASVTIGAEDLKKDYFPLSVEYQERLYAGGRIKGSRWVKREGRPTDAETLSARLIDRSLRPLFPKSFRREVQVIIMVLSVDGQNDPDVLGILAAGAALSISPIPWAGPIGAVRVGLIENLPVVNPLDSSSTDLDLVVTSTASHIHMLESGAKQVPEDQFYAALEAGFVANKQIIEFVTDFASTVGVDKFSLTSATISADLKSQIQKDAAPLIADYLSSSATKEGASLKDITTQISASLDEKDRQFVPALLEELAHHHFHKQVLDSKSRPDGRKFDEIRPLDLRVGVLPRVHGSAVFQRGQTQALTITTLGAPSLSQSLETAEGEETKRYMHHYNFPPFSTGEVGRVGTPGRREIGHGALAERALGPVIPSEASFPYAIRVVSEVLSSNGSTSMASTCGSTLSLMDAGVPLLAPVAGISIGLVTGSDYPRDEKFTLLTDIIGLEDHYGDMDFKVAGTAAGITAVQLDVKIVGLTLDICRQTLDRAKTARLFILDKIKAVLPQPRAQVSVHAPKISTVQIPVDRIGELIGPGGKIIRKLMADTGTIIDVRDDGSVFVSGPDQIGLDKAISWISSLGKDVVAGEIYDGTVVRIQPFGAFVNILPGKDGLVHVSQMDSGFVSDPRQIVQEGDVVKVWVTEIDSQGRVNLSMLFDATGQPAVKAREERAPARSQFDAPRGAPRSDRPRRRY